MTIRPPQNRPPPRRQPPPRRPRPEVAETASTTLSRPLQTWPPAIWQRWGLQHVRRPPLGHHRDFRCSAGVTARLVRMIEAACGTTTVQGAAGRSGGDSTRSPLCRPSSRSSTGSMAKSSPVSCSWRLSVVMVVNIEILAIRRRIWALITCYATTRACIARTDPAVVLCCATPTTRLFAWRSSMSVALNTASPLRIVSRLSLPERY